MEENTRYSQKDEIDLREFFTVLKKRKKIIFILTTLIILTSIIYALTIKPTSIYKGTALIEIGQIINEKYSDGKYSSLQINDLDNVLDLKELMTTLFKIEASVPEETKLLIVSFTDSNKSTIKPKLQKVISYTLHRNHELAKLYAGPNYKIKNTHLVGDIEIEDLTKQPKKKLIIGAAFITGLILSIFLAFFFEFWQGIGKIEDSDILQ